MNFIDENMGDHDDQEYEEDAEKVSPGQRAETTYYSEDEEQDKEEDKKNGTENDGIYEFGKGSSRGAQQ